MRYQPFSLRRVGAAVRLASLGVLAFLLLRLLVQTVSSGLRPPSLNTQIPARLPRTPREGQNLSAVIGSPPPEEASVSSDRPLGLSSAQVAAIRSASGDASSLLEVLYDLSPSPRSLPLRCTLKPTHRARYAALVPPDGELSHTRIVIALKLADAGAALPSIIRSLKELIEELGPKRVHVVALDAGSTDGTPGLMLLLARVLHAVGTTYTFTSLPHRTRPHGRRQSTQPAVVRNQLLLSLADPDLEQKVGGSFDQVLFVDGVVFCASDAMEVLFQHGVQAADMACGVDFTETMESNPLVRQLGLNLEWTSRDMMGL